MASHVRQQMREAIVTALTGLDTTGTRVYASRVYPVQQSELPGLLVYVTGESVETLTIHANAHQQRSIEVSVEVVFGAIADLDDTLDQCAQEVEVALASGVSVDSHTVQVTYTGIEIELEAGAQQPHGSARLNFTATLFTLATTPDVVSGS
jgi:hypothetical protein